MKFLFGCLLTLSLLVSAKSQAAVPAYADNIGYGLDGLWFDATIDQFGNSSNGQGFDVKYIKRQNGAEELIVYWYVYDSTGTRQVWLMATGPLIGNSATLQILRFTGGKFNLRTPPAQLVQQTVGTMQFTLADCNSAFVSWSFNQSFDGISGSGSQTLTRLSPLLTIHGYDLCTTPLSYFDPDRGDSEYNSLLAEYNSLLNDYNSLYDDYDYLYSEYNSLNTDYNYLLSDYNSLYDDYDDLYDDYMWLYSDYTSLSWDYDDLLSDYNDLYDECYGWGWAQGKSGTKVRKVRTLGKTKAVARAASSKLPKKSYLAKAKKTKKIARRISKAK